jgi:hypothetical protein
MLLHVLHSYLLHIFELLFNVLCQCALTKEIGNEKSIVEVLETVHGIDLLSPYLLG